MGCVNPKLKKLDSIEDNSGSVEPVYSIGQNDVPYQNGTIKSLNNKLKKNLNNNKNSDNRSIIASEDGSEDLDGRPGKNKAAKYKAKFDSRVTAKYDIKALIGRGSFSRVVRVEHKITCQPYAIKLIDRKHGREVFEAELNVLRRVRHAHIIQLIEVFESRYKVYMVMELATGGELFDRIISKGSFTERDATRVLRMVLDGVRYLHSLGIAHRDLKPENLLYYHPGADSKILITDFGLSATWKSGEDLMHTTCGTPEYVAPEILARRPYTCSIDLWALGVISYILLCGKMPFYDENRPRLYRLVLKAKYSYSGEHWKDISLLAKDFIDKLLRLDSSERLTATEALRHNWIITNAASSSNKNLHQTISQNLLQQRQSSRANSVVVKSVRSAKSSKSNRSNKSLRSDNRHVSPEEIDELHMDPEVQADIESLHNYSNPSNNSSAGQTLWADLFRVGDLARLGNLRVPLGQAHTGIEPMPSARSVI